MVDGIGRRNDRGHRWQGDGNGGDTLGKANATLGKAIHVGSHVVFGAVTPYVVCSECIDDDYENAGADLGFSTGAEYYGQGKQRSRDKTCRQVTTDR
jgi:hypothetical protein